MNLRLEALGTVDEATSALGVARAWTEDARAKELIYQVQTDCIC